MPLTADGGFCFQPSPWGTCAWQRWTGAGTLAYNCVFSRQYHTTNAKHIFVYLTWRLCNIISQFLSLLDITHRLIWYSGNTLHSYSGGNWLGYWISSVRFMPHLPSLLVYFWTENDRPLCAVRHFTFSQERGRRFMPSSMLRHVNQ
jgi:hypothetical protein